ncbi:MAG: hypothetical protein KAI22_02405 [Gammaproteobacteria bacterium]|nr:hypothetical protein [Gammaproteobacteria bacterium]
MEIDEDKIDEAVIALLYLTLHDANRAWKSFDWDTLNRLYEKGLINDPVNKTKSVVLTDAGLQKSEELFNTLFTK